MEDMEQRSRQGGIGFVEAPTGFGKTSTTLSALLGYEEKPIIYLTRTHNQMQQVAKELRIVNQRGYDFKGIIRGSRRFLCINPDVNTSGSHTEMVESCLTHLRSADGVTLLDYLERGSASVNGDDISLRERTNLRCPYADVPTTIPRGVPSVADVESLIQYGQRNHICPYYLAQILARKRRVVVGSYNYLFLGDLPTKDAILVLDEAHNIEAMCRKAYSLQITQRTVKSALRETREGEGFGAINWEELTQEVQEFFSRVNLPNTEIGILTPQKTLKLLEENGLGKNFLESIEASWADLSHLHVEIMHERGRVFPLESLRVHSIFSFFHRIIKEPPEHFVGILDQKEPKKLSWTCLDPSLAFRMIQEKKPHAILLMSGTLNPMDNLGRILGVKADMKTYPSIIPSKNVQLLVLGKGPNNEPLTSEYKHRNNPLIREEYGETVRQIVKHVPNGSLVFFPSYGFMRQSLQIWKQKGILDKLTNNNHKLFYETQSSGKSLIKDYKKHASNGKAVLFAVCRGKLSEGADFPDATGRAVILIGLPFPDLSDPKIKAQRQYFEQKGKGLGTTWYLNEAIRTVNQTLGRVWRHQQDYALGCLLDNRYYWSSNFGKISAWLKQRTYSQNREDTFNDILRQIEEFYKGVESHS